jgi:ferredoxin
VTVARAVAVTVDPTLCIGSGTCERLSPDDFQVGDDGVATFIGRGADPERWENAARACPVGAIDVTVAPDPDR